MAPRAARQPLLLSIRHGEVVTHVHDAGLAAQHIQAVSSGTSPRTAGRDLLAAARHGLADTSELLTDLLSDALGTPCAGLQQAARSARQQGILGSKLANRLCRLGEAAAEVRHFSGTAMALVVKSTKEAVTEAAFGARSTCLPSASASPGTETDSSGSRQTSSPVEEAPAPLDDEDTEVINKLPDTAMDQHELDGGATEETRDTPMAGGVTTLPVQARLGRMGPRCAPPASPRRGVHPVHLEPAPFVTATQPAEEPASWQVAAADPGAQSSGRGLRCIGVQAAVPRRASRGMQTVEHACDTCVVFLELSQKVCQCQADVSCLADRLSELSSSALLAGQERARLADEVAAAHERMEKKGMSGLTDAVLRQSETNVRALRLNDEARAACFELLADQRQMLDLMDLLSRRHAEAVAHEQAIRSEQAASTQAVEATRIALASAVQELGAWLQTHLDPTMALSGPAKRPPL